MMDKLRIRHGLYWEGPRPGWNELKRWIAGVIAFALLAMILGMVDRVEAETEARIAAEKAADIYASHAQVMRDCENGAAGYYYKDGRAYECGGRL